MAVEDGGPPTQFRTAVEKLGLMLAGWGFDDEHRRRDTAAVMQAVLINKKCRCLYVIDILNHL
jgi:hypothetical protein